MRGSNADVICPKLLEPSPLLTWLNSVWFQVLNVSTRSSKRLPRLSLITKLLKSERFQLSRPGPRSELCPASPHAPIAGNANDAVLNHSPTVCGYETLATWSGRFVALGKPWPLCPPVSCGLIGGWELSGIVTIPSRRSVSLRTYSPSDGGLVCRRRSWPTRCAYDRNHPRQRRIASRHRGSIRCLGRRRRCRQCSGRSCATACKRRAASGHGQLASSGQLADRCSASSLRSCTGRWSGSPNMAVRVPCCSSRRR